MSAMKEMALQHQIDEVTQYQRDTCPTCGQKATCSGTMTQGANCMTVTE